MLLAKRISAETAPAVDPFVDRALLAALGDFGPDSRPNRRAVRFDACEFHDDPVIAETGILE